MQWLKQSTAATITIGPVLDSTGAAYTGAVIGDFNITKNGTTAALAASAAVTHSHEGTYLLDLTTTNTNTLGRLDISCNKATYAMPQKSLTVLQATVFDALVTNATTAAGGLGDVQRIAGTAQTARDIGASVLLSVGTGTGQVNLSSGKAPATIAAGDIATDAITAASVKADAVTKIQNGLATPTNITSAIGITVSAIGNNVITAAAIADGAIDAATFAADVDAEILSYLVDDATRLDASALNTATGTTIPAIVADTNELQTEWADGGRLDVILDARASQASVDTVDGIVDSILVDTAEIGAAGSGLTAIPWNAAWDTEVQSEVDDALTAFGVSTITTAQVNTEMDTALADIHLDHLLATTYDPASKPGAADALLNEIVESDAGVSRFTENALEQAPGGGGGGLGDGDLDEIIAGVSSALAGSPITIQDSVTPGGVVTIIQGQTYASGARLLRIQNDDFPTLTGATAVIRYRDGEGTVVNVASTAVDNTDKYIQFDVTAAVSAAFTKGKFAASLIITLSGGAVHIVPLTRVVVTNEYGEA